MHVDCAKLLSSLMSILANDGASIDPPPISCSRDFYPSVNLLASNQLKTTHDHLSSTIIDEDKWHQPAKTPPHFLGSKFGFLRCTRVIQ